MNFTWPLAALTLVGCLLLLGLAGWLMFRRGRSVSVPVATRALAEQRERMQANFFTVAAASGKPRGLRWTGCDFGPDATLARDRRTRHLFAFVPVAISFEAIPGSDMEGLPAVGNLRTATAVFRFDEGVWATDGRALFNMDPDEALSHFSKQYESIAINTGS